MLLNYISCENMFLLFIYFSNRLLAREKKDISQKVFGFSQKMTFAADERRYLTMRLMKIFKDI